MAKEVTFHENIDQMFTQLFNNLSEIGNHILNPLYEEAEQLLMLKKTRNKKVKAKPTRKLLPIDELSAVDSFQPSSTSGTSQANRYGTRARRGEISTIELVEQEAPGSRSGRGVRKIVQEHIRSELSTVATEESNETFITTTTTQASSTATLCLTTDDVRICDEETPQNKTKKLKNIVVLNENAESYEPKIKRSKLSISDNVIEQNTITVVPQESEPINETTEASQMSLIKVIPQNDEVIPPAKCSKRKTRSKVTKPRTKIKIDHEIDINVDGKAHCSSTIEAPVEIPNDVVSDAPNNALPPDNIVEHVINEIDKSVEIEGASFCINLDMHQSTPKAKINNHLPFNQEQQSKTTYSPDHNASAAEEINKSPLPHSSVSDTNSPVPEPRPNHKSRTKIIVNAEAKNHPVISSNDGQQDCGSMIDKPLYEPPMEQRITRTKAKQIEKEKKMAEDILNSVQNRPLDEMPRAATTGKKIFSKVDNIQNTMTPCMPGSNPKYLKQPTIQITPFKPIKLKGKFEKENLALIKKEEFKKITSEQVRLKRENKMKKANENKLAVEKKKADYLLKLQKEREEKEKIARAEREKQREEFILKKKQHELRLQEVEERRQKEEAARLAKLKEQEEEQNRLAAIRLQQEKEAALLFQKQQAEEQKRKALEAALGKKHLVWLPSTKKDKNEVCPSSTVTLVNDIDISDDALFEAGNNTHKNIYASWTTSRNMRPILEVQSKLTCFSTAFHVNSNPNSKDLFNESVVSSEHRQRSSSVFWNSPHHQSKN